MKRGTSSVGRKNGVQKRPSYTGVRACFAARLSGAEQSCSLMGYGSSVSQTTAAKNLESAGTPLVKEFSSCRPPVSRAQPSSLSGLAILYSRPVGLFRVARLFLRECVSSFVSGSASNGGMPRSKSRTYPHARMVSSACDAQTFEEMRQITLPQLCPNYMALCVRIGKIDRLRAASNA